MRNIIKFMKLEGILSYKKDAISRNIDLQQGTKIWKVYGKAIWANKVKVKK